LALIKEIIEKVGLDLMADQELAPHIIEPPESRGVVRMEEFSMVLGVKCMTKPDDGRFIIRREAYHRIRDAFEESGIRFARHPAKAETSGNTAKAKITAGLMPEAAAPETNQANFEHELAFNHDPSHDDHAP
ncbi:MAG: hypothetical protein WCC64_07415, partial [Aliidongia sp.]